MFNYFDRPQFQYGQIQVIEDIKCMQTWQLDDWTKELMGYEWVKEFEEWAKSNLPKQPACYMVGDDTMITHPSIVEEIREHVKAQHEGRKSVRTMMALRFSTVVSGYGSVIATNCIA